ncbi:hypothetical protein ACIQW5_11335 [Methylorubrum thiocyanatum]|uniref:hypothetical protein n=1 Tax=Methylorubrum thiocyanatum TaxID=47958 RepID=UPI00383AE9ED
MSKSGAMTDAFESFAHSLRILLEAHFGAYELLMVDPHEAAGNVEQGLSQLLNSIASLYDVAQSVPGIDFDWYGTPETAVLLSIRNARHHNHANRIRGLYNFHLQQPSPQIPRKYVFVDYPETKDGGKGFDIPVSWFDFATLLSMPQKASRIRPSAVESMKGYLLADKFDSYATEYGVPSEMVFFNLNPLIVNAGIKFVPFLKPYITPRSMEGKWFAGHFENVERTDPHTHKTHVINVFLPA